MREEFCGGPVDPIPDRVRGHVTSPLRRADVTQYSNFREVPERSTTWLRGVGVGGEVKVREWGSPEEGAWPGGGTACSRHTHHSRHGEPKFSFLKSGSLSHMLVWGPL